MKFYNVAFIKDGIFQVNIVKTYHDAGIVYRYYARSAKVLDVKPTRIDDIKPGMPVVEF